MDDSYEGRIGRLQSLSQDLKQYLSSLPAEAWGSPSACDQWQVRDVVAHLVDGAESYINSVSRGLQGDTSPPEGRLPAGSDSAVSSAERIAQGAISTRRRLGGQLLPTFEATDNRLTRLLGGLNTEERSKPCYHGGGLVPAENFVDLRLNELAIHDWDIRSRLEGDARLSLEGLPSTMLMFTRSLAAGSLRWAFWPGPPLPTPVSYRFQVTGPVPIQADITVQGDRVRLSAPGEAVADATFRCDTETFVLLMYGRVKPAMAISGGRLAVEGDRDLASQFSQWFKGI